MTKKLLALLLALSMALSVCSFSVFAVEADSDEAVVMEATDVSEPENEPETDEETQPASEPDGDEEDTPSEPENEKDATLDIKNSYFANDTVVITGTTTGVTDVMIVVESNGKEKLKKDISATRFESEGVKYVLEDANAGAEYFVYVYDYDTYDEEGDNVALGEASFVIKKDSSDVVDDGTNRVTIWIEGTNARYIDETVVSLDSLKYPTVLELAEYVLEEADREFKSTKKKVTGIASTATGATYTLKDGATSSYFKDGEWAYIINGDTTSAKADFDGDWTDRELTGGDKVVLFFAVPDKNGDFNVGYPVFEVDPEAIGVKDEVTVSVTQKLFTANVDDDDEDKTVGYTVEEVAKTGKVYFIKRGTTSIGTAKTTNADGEVILKSSSVTSSWITSYQGGEILVSGYVSASKPLTMVSVKEDLVTEREGTVQAWVRIEGAHETLLERTKSAKIDEYDLYNFMLEVLEDEDIDYETNNNETNFEKFELKSTGGYSNENGDIHDDAGWYVVVNDTIYTPDDDLEEVEIFANDEILFYYGDEDTVPVVYCKVDETIKVGKTAYAYFYSDKEMTKPIDDLDVYFDGGSYNDKRITTNSSGKVTLPDVEKKGDYTLWWGEHVAVKSDDCPTAVYGEVEIEYTGTVSDSSGGGGGGGGSSGGTSTTTKYECDYCEDMVTKLYAVEYKGIELDVCSSCRNELEEEEAESDKKDEDEDEDWITTTPDDKDEDEKEEKDPTTGWEDGDYKDPTVPKDPNLLPENNGQAPQSYLYPDTNFDWWAVPNVEKAHQYGLMSGTTYGYFEPLREITRAEFTTIICRILGLDTTAELYTQQFADVKPTDWHYGYVMAAYSAGYVTGKSDVTFNPNDLINREEIAVLIARIINVQGNAMASYSYIDTFQISDWARESVAAVNQVGIMTGDQFNQFSPKSNVNRQTVATIVVRLYEYLHK